MTTIGLKVRYYGDPCLRKPCEPVESVGPAERVLIQSMFKTMHDSKGIGLAAPQIGINKKIFVVDTGEEGQVFAAVNPRVIKGSGHDVMEEGCLSIPGVDIKVKRPKTVVVEFTNENNERKTYEMTGLVAKVFQHENDHLNGKLITDYASLPEKIKYRSVLKELEKKNKP